MHRILQIRTSLIARCSAKDYSINANLNKSVSLQALPSISWIITHEQGTHFYCINRKLAFFVSKRKTQEVLGVLRKTQATARKSTHKLFNRLVQIRSVEFFLIASALAGRARGTCQLSYQGASSATRTVWYKEAACETKQSPAPIQLSTCVYLLEKKVWLLLFFLFFRNHCCTGLVRKKSCTSFFTLEFFFLGSMQQFVSAVYIFIITYRQILCLLTTYHWFCESCSRWLCHLYNYWDHHVPFNG